MNKKLLAVLMIPLACSAQSKRRSSSGRSRLRASRRTLTPRWTGPARSPTGAAFGGVAQSVFQADGDSALRGGCSKREAKA